MAGTIEGREALLTWLARLGNNDYVPPVAEPSATTAGSRRA